jgi:hypothetical protein
MNNPFLLGKIKFVKGNAALPVAADYRVILILCPDNGNFEIVPRNERISKSYQKAKDAYRSWWRGQLNFKLGKTNITSILSDTELAHAVVCVEKDGELFFDKKALEQAFEELARYCSTNKRNVHLNKAGNDSEWAAINEIITNTLLKKGVNVWVYEE